MSSHLYIVEFKNLETGNGDVCLMTPDKGQAIEKAFEEAASFEKRGAQIPAREKAKRKVRVFEGTLRLRLNVTPRTYVFESERLVKEIDVL